MSKKDGRKTADEIRQQQKLLEDKEDEERRQAQLEAREVRRREQAAATQVSAAHIKATWHDLAVTASQRPGIRFVVLAEVHAGEGVDEVLKELEADMKSLNFEMRLVSGTTKISTGTKRPQSASRPDEEFIAAMKGIRPESVSKLGPDAGIKQTLVVSWNS